MVRRIRRNYVALDELGRIWEDLAEVGGEGPGVGEDGCGSDNLSKFIDWFLAILAVCSDQTVLKAA